MQNDKIHDTAGGGLRGLRAKPSANSLTAVCAAYGILNSSDIIDLGGSANMNLLMKAANN